MPQKTWSRRGVVFLSLWLGYFGFYFCRKNLSVANTTLQHELGFTADGYAALVGVYSIMYMAGQFLSGYLADRKGAKPVILTGLFVSAGANLLMGFGSLYLMFFLLGALNGLGQSTGWSGSVKVLSSWFTPAERGVATGWWTTSYVAGGFVATIFATLWITNTTILPQYTWQKAFWAPALVLALIGLILLSGVKNSPLVQERGKQAEKRPEANNTEDTGYLHLIRKPELWIVSMTYFFLKFIRYSFLFWLPAYLEVALGYSTGNAGYLSSIFEFAGFAGIIFAGYLSDHWLTGRRMAVSAILLAALAVTFLLQPLLIQYGMGFVAILIFLTGFTIYGPDSVLSGALAIDIGTGKSAAKASGFINGMGSAGQLASPFFVAFITSRFGWDLLFKVFLLMALISVLLLIIKWGYRANENYSLT